MNTGVLERIRLLEADLEHARDAAVYQQLLPISNARHVLLRDHYIHHQRRVMQETAAKLLDLYLEDDEHAEAQLDSQPLEDALRDYDAKVAQVREYSRTHSFIHASSSSAGAAAAVSDAVEYVDPAEEEPDVDAFLSDLFSSVENFGTRLECYETGFNEYASLLVKCATKDINAVAGEKRKLKSVEEFAASIPAAFNLSTAVKLLLPNDYDAFVTNILEYLTGFHRRLRPLEGRLLESEMKAAEADMRQYWQVLVDASNRHLDSGSSSSFQPPGRPVKYLPAMWRPHQLLRKIRQLKEQGDVEGAAKVEAELGWCEAAAIKEAKVGKLVSGILSEVCTTSEVVFRSNMTKMPAEVQRERNHEEEAFLISLEESAHKKAAALSKNLAHNAEFDARLLDLNTKSGAAFGGDGGSLALAGTSGAHVTTVSLADESMVPLDEDGNPLPLWQIKMQGLRKKYHCEVCGGTVYSGPKVYKEHFFSERHTEGLRRLGIRNRREFDGINTIDGVFDLARLMQGKQVLKRAREEFLARESEDNDGIVISEAEFRRRFQR